MNNNFFENYSNSYKLFEPHVAHNFIGYDSESLYKYNLKNNYSLLEKNNWIGKEVKYWYNNYGFRTYDDFNTENYGDVNMFFGCSLTDGVGLNIEDIWAYKINQKLGGSFYNFGQSGSGIEVTYRLLKSWTSKIVPKNIFILIYSLHKGRREFLHSENYNDNGFSPHNVDCNILSILVKEFKNDMLLQKQKSKFYFDFLASKKEIEVSYERTWDAILYNVSKLNCNVYVPKQYKILKAVTICRKNNFYARDCSHVGTQFHDIISDFDCWEKIN
jgi:hypothetical protein